MISLPCGRFRLAFRGDPLVMGILNVTPDSFSDGGRFLDCGKAVDGAERMASEGAALVDVGGESTRPGAAPVALSEELGRVIPVIRAAAKRLRVPISVDTFKAEVAQRALDAGASLVNDVTALRGDPEMARVIARERVPVILMHMRGTPRIMQRAPRYRDVVQEVRAFLAEAIRRAEAAGIAEERLLIDPGLGFGKTVTHNLELLRHLGDILDLGRPVVIGPSRKSFIGATLDVPVGERLAGTLACLEEAARHGAHIVRVHDVKPAVQFLQMRQALGERNAPRREHRPRRHRAPSPAGFGA